MYEVGVVLEDNTVKKVDSDENLENAKLKASQYKNDYKKVFIDKWRMTANGHELDSEFYEIEV